MYIVLAIAVLFILFCIFKGEDMHKSVKTINEMRADYEKNPSKYRNIDEIYKHQESDYQESDYDNYVPDYDNYVPDDDY